MARNLKFSSSTPPLLGFGLRIHQLGASGFAEDEMNKLSAVRSYKRGDFSANGEHPMVMKVLMWGFARKVGFYNDLSVLRDLCVSL